MIQKIKFLLAFLFVSVLTLNGQIKLPKLISDGMVLQRDTNIKIWGWASPKEKITIHFLNKDYKTTANRDGEWEFQLKNLKAGGPYTMKLEGKNTMEIHNILVGDVWLCSGQSNMAYQLKKSSKLYQDDIANSENKYIRQFAVPKATDFKNPLKDVASGAWISAKPKTVVDFSAAAYFFARELYDTYQIPVGLINASVGGTPAQAWISESGLKEFTHYKDEVQLLKNDSFINEIENANKNKLKNWITTATSQDLAYQDPNNNWSQELLDDTDWETMAIPGSWVKKIGYTNGIIWFRKNIKLNNTMQPATLNLGRISDADSVFVNGHFIGSTSHKYDIRNYKIPNNILKKGDNTIAIRTTSYRFNGGFIHGYPIDITTGSEKTNLKGAWKFKIGAKMKALEKPVQLTWKPAGLYNAMIAPLLNYGIKGAIWYQGEGNVAKAQEYHTLFPALINDWRVKFNQNDLPFLFVQLANFQKPVKNPRPSNWALLRDAQLNTLKMQNTGMAVIIDIGEANDIHPKNKKDVGKRLAFEAKRVAYKTSNIQVAQYRSMEVKGNKIILSFHTYGSALKVKNNGVLKEFAIAGKDKKFVWAEAIITKDKIVVSSKEIKNPIAVRYAWADNPDKANLINSEALPVSPFRTDDWDK